MTLTKIQIAGIASRKRRGLIRWFGVPTPPGTRPQQQRPQAKAAFVPTKRTPVWQEALGLLALSERISGFFRRQWWNRRQRCPHG